jgi:hypothetical protein
MRPIGHIDFDFIPGPGLEIMAIDSDVERPAERRESAVAMSEEMPRIKMASVPDPQAVVAEDDKISFDEGCVHLCHAGKWAPAGINDIGMIEMRVSRKINISH